MLALCLWTSQPPSGLPARRPPQRRRHRVRQILEASGNGWRGSHERSCSGVAKHGDAAGVRGVDRARQRAGERQRGRKLAARRNTRTTTRMRRGWRLGRSRGARTRLEQDGECGLRTRTRLSGRSTAASPVRTAWRARRHTGTRVKFNTGRLAAGPKAGRGCTMRATTGQDEAIASVEGWWTVCVEGKKEGRYRPLRWV